MFGLMGRGDFLDIRCRTIRLGDRFVFNFFVYFLTRTMYLYIYNNNYSIY